MRIASEHLEQIVEHARRDAPNECCGVVGVRDGVATGVHELTNIHASPFRFEPEPGELVRTYSMLDADGADVGAIYHSHTRSAPEPSQTDIHFARNWPGVRWIIVGLADGEPQVCTWLIGADGEVVAAPLEVA